jgi:hypothetical protein
MTRNDEYDAGPAPKAALSVVVIYEDSAAREQAVDFCDQLVKRFWAGFEFEMNWWSFSLLQANPAAMDAAEKAAHADLVVVASMQPQDFPRGVKSWIESWLGRRGDREGILAGLVGPVPGGSGSAPAKHLYLRQVAHRGGMDYLTQVPQGISHATPQPLDFYTARAALVSGVLDEILHHRTPPPTLT